MKQSYYYILWYLENFMFRDTQPLEPKTLTDVQSQIGNKKEKIV